MSLPPKIKIGPYEYEVLECEQIKSDKGEDCWGLQDTFNHKIMVSSKIKPDRQKVVLIHELLHALYELQGLPRKAEEEHVVTCLAPVLFQVLKENPELSTYMTE